MIFLSSFLKPFTEDALCLENIHAYHFQYAEGCFVGQPCDMSAKNMALCSQCDTPIPIEVIWNMKFTFYCIPIYPISSSNMSLKFKKPYIVFPAHNNTTFNNVIVFIYHTEYIYEIYLCIIKYYGSLLGPLRKYFFIFIFFLRNPKI